MRKSLSLTILAFVLISYIFAVNITSSYTQQTSPFYIDLETTNYVEFEENAFNDSSTSKDLTYSSSEWKTVYVKIPKDAQIISAFMDVSGLSITETPSTAGDTPCQCDTGGEGGGCSACGTCSYTPTPSGTPATCSCTSPYSGTSCTACGECSYTPSTPDCLCTSPYTGGGCIYTTYYWTQCKKYVDFGWISGKSHTYTFPTETGWTFAKAVFTAGAKVVYSSSDIPWASGDSAKAHVKGQVDDTGDTWGGDGSCTVYGNDVYAISTKTGITVTDDPTVTVRVIDDAGVADTYLTVYTGVTDCSSTGSVYDAIGSEIYYTTAYGYSYIKKSSTSDYPTCPTGWTLDSQWTNSQCTSCHLCTYTPTPNDGGCNACPSPGSGTPDCTSCSACTYTPDLANNCQCPAPGSGYACASCYDCTYYPYDPEVDSTGDGVDEWSYAGKFTSTATVDLNLNNAIQNYLSTCTPDADGKCLVPIKVYSSTKGKIRLSNLQVKYRINLNTYTTSWGEWNQTDNIIAGAYYKKVMHINTSGTALPNQVSVSGYYISDGATRCWVDDAEYTVSTYNSRQVCEYSEVINEGSLYPHHKIEDDISEYIAIEIQDGTPRYEQNLVYRDSNRNNETYQFITGNFSLVNSDPQTTFTNVHYDLSNRLSDISAVCHESCTGTVSSIPPSSYDLIIPVYYGDWILESQSGWTQDESKQSTIWKQFIKNELRMNNTLDIDLEKINYTSVDSCPSGFTCDGWKLMDVPANSEVVDYVFGNGSSFYVSYGDWKQSIAKQSNLTHQILNTTLEVTNPTSIDFQDVLVNLSCPDGFNNVESNESFNGGETKILFPECIGDVLDEKIAIGEDPTRLTEAGDWAFTIINVTINRTQPINFTNILLNLKRDGWDCQSLQYVNITQNITEIPFVANCSKWQIINKTQTPHIILNDTVIVDEKVYGKFNVTIKNNDNINYSKVLVRTTLPDYYSNETEYQFITSLNSGEEKTFSVLISGIPAVEKQYIRTQSQSGGFIVHRYEAQIEVRDDTVSEKVIKYVIPISRLTGWDKRNSSYDVIKVDDQISGIYWNVTDENLTITITTNFTESSLHQGLHTIVVEYSVPAPSQPAGGGGSGKVGGELPTLQIDKSELNIKIPYQERCAEFKLSVYWGSSRTKAKIYYHGDIGALAVYPKEGEEILLERKKWTEIPFKFCIPNETFQQQPYTTENVTLKTYTGSIEIFVSTFWGDISKKIPTTVSIVKEVKLPKPLLPPPTRNVLINLISEYRIPIAITLFAIAILLFL